MNDSRLACFSARRAFFSFLSFFFSERAGDGALSPAYLTSAVDL